MAGSIRSFIAIELPEDIRDRLQALQDSFKSHKLNIRWVDPGNIHLTLKFLGNISEGEIEKVAAALSASVGPRSPLSLCAKGVGAFPGLNRPRVIWVGIGGQSADLAALQKALEDRLTGEGFNPDVRPFKGHLTLGRVKGALKPDVFRKALQEGMSFETEPFAVAGVSLFRSVLKPGGAVYSRLFTVSLGKQPV